MQRDEITSEEAMKLAVANFHSNPALVREHILRLMDLEDFELFKTLYDGNLYNSIEGMNDDGTEEDDIDLEKDIATQLYKAGIIKDGDIFQLGAPHQMGVAVTYKRKDGSPLPSIRTYNTKYHVAYIENGMLKFARTPEKIEIDKKNRL